MVNLALRSRIGWDTQVDTLYWIGLKALVWVLPAVLAIRWIERAPVAHFLRLRDPARGLMWGVSMGIGLVLVNYIAKTLPAGTTLHVPSLGLPLLNAVIVAPLVEEIAMRGYLLRALESSGRPFWRANVVTTLTFLMMHLPGWYFQSRVGSAAAIAQRLVPLAIFSLLLGWITRHSGSLYAPITLHVINNLYSVLFP